LDKQRGSDTKRQSAKQIRELDKREILHAETNKKPYFTTLIY